MLGASWTTLAALLFTAVTLVALLFAVVAFLVPDNAAADHEGRHKAFDFWLECGFTSVTEGESNVSPTLHWAWKTVSAFNSSTQWLDFHLYTHPKGLTTVPDDGESIPQISDESIRLPFSLQDDAVVEASQELLVYVTPIDRVVDNDDPERDMKCHVTLYDDDPAELLSAEITSTPLRGDTYGVNETIELTVEFSHPVHRLAGYGALLGLVGSYRLVKLGPGLSASITEDDTIGVTIDPTTLTIGEGERSTYTVVLTSQPAGDVTVTITGHADTDLGIASAGLNSDDELTFTTANWNTAQTVTLTAAQDEDALQDEDITLVHAVSSDDDAAYHALADETVMVSIAEDDAAGVSISPTALTVTEGDATGVSYTVVLTSQPAGDVTVTITGHADTDLGIASAGLNSDDELTFTTANWNTAQTVTVSAAQDEDAVHDEDITLLHAVSSTGDAAYHALADETVMVSIAEDDAAGVSISPTTLTVTEGDATGVSYTVVLTSQPAGDVVVVAFSKTVARFSANTPSAKVTGGTISAVQAHAEDGLKNAYMFFLTPDGDDDVTFTLVADAACASGGVCTAGGTPLTEVPPALTIPGPEETELSELSVNDAEASEEDDSVLDFVVKLNPASAETVSVDYATANGTAAAGDDYTATSGTLTFAAGETTKTIRVPIIDDAIDDDNETVTLMLSNASRADIDDAIATGTIRNSEAAAEPLTASFKSMPTEHDGNAAFSFHVEFSEDVSTSDKTSRDDSFTVTDGDVTNAQRVDGRDDLWQITVEPDARADVTIALPGNRACGSTGAVCTRGDNPQPLTNSPSATIAGPPREPLTASFGNMPAGHDGNEFSFDLSFSENIKVGFRKIRDDAFKISGGNITEVQRKEQGTNIEWTITVQPNGNGAVSITLPETSNCNDVGAICTDDGRKLSNSTSESVQGPVGISVGDALVQEAAGAVLTFAVTLSRMAANPITVNYATSDGSAQAGSDYTAASGRLTIAAGVSSRTIQVSVLDDSTTEGSETLTLILSNPSGARLSDADATGTIED